MAYATTNPPVRIGQTLTGNSLWYYSSADDDATVNGADYFSNAAALGMKKGDFVLVFDTTTPKGSLHYVSAVDTDGNGTTAFAAVA